MTKINENFNSALRVQEGIEQPSSVNPSIINKIQKHKTPKISVDEYLDGILSGSRTILSRAITLIESVLPEHQHLAQQIIEKCLPYSGNSIRLGITGVPGVGKSTFIEALGRYLTRNGNKLAVLAIDPSSQRSKGSILGDKTRMEELAVDSLAFIRPSPSAGSLGGVSRKTRESIILCEAAGFNVIFVETVGVGQSETSVYGMVDFFLLLMLAGAGDELQGIKRGIMEMADAIIINKADGDNITKANLAKTEYTNALHLFPPPPSGWEPKVDTCSAVTKDGVSRIWKTVLDYIDLTKRNGYFLQKRKEQSQQIMSDYIQFQLSDSFYRYPLIKKTLPSAEQNVLEGKISAYVAAQKLLDSYLHSLSKK